MTPPPESLQTGLLMTVATIGYLMVALWPLRTSLPMAATRVLPLAWVLHTLALLLTLIDWSAPVPMARFGFAPALSMTLWGVVGVYLLEKLHTTFASALRALSLLAAVSLLLAWWFPGQAHPHIRHNWAPLHWMLGLTAYGLMGVALMHAFFWQRAEKKLRSTPTAVLDQGMPLLRLEALTFKFSGAAFAALTLALVVGIWHMQPWRWDHKTVLSLLAWLVFASLLAGRRCFGWRGRVAMRWLYAGSILLLLAYVGSRFVLEVILQRMPLSV